MGNQLLHRTQVYLNGNPVAYLTGLSGTGRKNDIIEAPPTADSDFDTPQEKQQGPTHAGSGSLTVLHDDEQRIKLEAARDGPQPVKLYKKYPSGAQSKEVDIFITDLTEPESSSVTGFLTTTINFEYKGIPTHIRANAAPPA